MQERLRQVLAEDPRIAFALVFGSQARGRATSESDVDVAIELREGSELSSAEIGALAARLEEASGKTVDLVLLDETAPGLAYRIFRDGRVLLDRDPGAMTARKARAIMEYLDFQPIEELCAEGVLGAASRGR